MRVQMMACRPTSHPLFERTTTLPPTRIAWDQHSDTKKHIDQSGSLRASRALWGKVGMMMGLLESLTDHPLQGQVQVSISRGSCDVSGSIDLYESSRERMVFETLSLVEQIGLEVSADTNVGTVTVSYFQQLKTLKGGAAVT